MRLRSIRRVLKVLREIRDFWGAYRPGVLVLRYHLRTGKLTSLTNFLVGKSSIFAVLSILVKRLHKYELKLMNKNIDPNVGRFVG